MADNQAPAQNQTPQQEPQRKYTVKVPEDIESGVYANAISVHFNNNECIIDMAYRLTNTQEPTVKVVSRINMSHKTAESFLKVLSNALLDYKNKKENTQPPQQ